MKLYAELATWKDADGARYAENVTPLARYFADSLVGYLVDLERPNRPGQANSAVSLNLLRITSITRGLTIKRAVTETAQRLSDRYQLRIETEAELPEMVSPCLMEAAVMSRLLDQAAFSTWLDQFLPAAHSPKFKRLRSISFDLTGPARRGGNRGQTDPGTAPSPRATWIGLAFTRADAYSRLASALPAADPRVAVFRRLAAIHAENGSSRRTRRFDAPWVGSVRGFISNSIGGARRRAAGPFSADPSSGGARRCADMVLSGSFPHPPARSKSKTRPLACDNAAGLFDHRTPRPGRGYLWEATYRRRTIIKDPQFVVVSIGTPR